VSRAETAHQLHRAEDLADTHEGYAPFNVKTAFFGKLRCTRSRKKERTSYIEYRRPYKGSILEPESHIGDIQKLQGLDIRGFLVNAQNKTHGPKGNPRNRPNVVDEG
jgi:hypothetical protein